MILKHFVFKDTLQLILLLIVGYNLIRMSRSNSKPYEAVIQSATTRSLLDESRAFS